jgi:hypothetical protein
VATADVEILLTAFEVPNMNAHDERSHQGIGNRIVSGAVPQSRGSIEARQPLDGMQSDYHRRAA